MSKLKLTSIAADKQTAATLEKNYLFKDVFLDITRDVYFNENINKQFSVKDIQAIYDIVAIQTSIKNCFLTSPGQRILSPEYGIDLRRYLFESINPDTAFFIQDDIRSRLPRFEPRITLRNVLVQANIDELQYDVSLTIDVPSLNIYGLTLKNFLNSNGYF